MRLLVATKNPGKFSEISEVLGSLSTGRKPGGNVPSNESVLELISLGDLGFDDEIEETGATHEENAILKAKYFFEKTEIPTLGEDSGIYVDAFPGELGVATRRWEGLHKATDAEWIQYFLEKMRKIPPEKRMAKFVCCAALILDKKSFAAPHIFTGETHGIITENLEAPLKQGIPISSCFRPEGSKKVYASLSALEKNKISHRGKAMHMVKEFLQGMI